MESQKTRDTWAIDINNQWKYKPIPWFFFRSGDIAPAVRKGKVLTAQINQQNRCGLTCDVHTRRFLQGWDRDETELWVLVPTNTLGLLHLVPQTKMSSVCAYVFMCVINRAGQEMFHRWTETGFGLQASSGMCHVCSTCAAAYPNVEGAKHVSPDTENPLRLKWRPLENINAPWLCCSMRGWEVELRPPAKHVGVSRLILTRKFKGRGQEHIIKATEGNTSGGTLVRPYKVWFHYKWSEN